MARTFLAVFATIACLAYLPNAEAVVPPLKQPTWLELSQEQQRILTPLAGEWDQLESWRRKKWLGIAARYSSMSEEEQARVQRRMVDWVKLSPSERRAVRDKYLNLQKAPPEHKEVLRQKWDEYKQLPDEEKQRLKAEAAQSKVQAKTAKSRPPVTVLSKPPVVAQTAPAAPAAVVPQSPPPAEMPAAPANSQ